MFMFLPPGSFPVLRELTEEERQQILHSSEFQSFFDCSIRVMERALAEDGDIFFDYGGRDLEDKEGLAGRGQEGGREGGKESVFGCERAHVFTCMPQTKKCAQTDSCPLCHCRGQEVPLFFKIHVFLLKSHSQGVKSVYELTTSFLKTALSCLKGCLQMEVIKVLVDVIRVISANLF